MIGESYHQGYYFGGISVCDFTLLQEKLYDYFKHAKSLKEVKVITEEEKNLFLMKTAKM